jgi:2-oxo-hept-3-ene-1,7-dioate hydratase
MVTTNGTFTADGVGSNALEDPMNALVRLANGLARRGLSLAAGDLVTSSNIYNEPVRPAAGDVIVADFGVLGNIEVTFG